MTHGIHRIEGPVLHDGCAECEARGNDPSVAIAHMDSSTFARAWQRAVLWQRDGELDDLQDAEMATLNVLWSVRCAFQADPVIAVPAGFTADGYAELFGE